MGVYCTPMYAHGMPRAYLGLFVGVLGAHGQTFLVPKWHKMGKYWYRMTLIDVQGSEDIIEEAQNRELEALNGPKWVILYRYS